MIYGSNLLQRRMFLIESVEVPASGNRELIAEKIAIPEAAALFSRARLLELLKQRLKRLLQSELGVEPGSETRKLYEELMT